VNRELIEAMHLDVHEALTLRELVELSGLAESVLRELIDEGALQPLDVNESTLRFSADCIVRVRTARRLYQDFELEPHALSLMLRLLERIDALEHELRRLRARSMR